MTEAERLLFRSLPGCTMTTDRWLNEELVEPTLHERAQRCQGVLVVGQHTLDGVFLAPSSAKNRFPCPSVAFRAEGKERLGR